MTIENEKIVLAFLWIALMLIYLLGDVLRIFSGNFVAGEIDGQPVKDSMWILAALMMVIPIIMIIVSIFVPIEVSKWISVVVAMLFFLINIVGIKGYKTFDQLLLVISFGINFLTVYYAWRL